MKKLKTIFGALDEYSPGYVWRISLLMVLVLTVSSVLFGHKVFIEIFYVIPVAITSWYGSKKSGVILALSSTIILFLTKTWHVDFQGVTIFSYSLPCAITLCLLAVLITNFRNVHRVESTAADTDDLTNVYNSRGFYVELANELVRSSRYEHIFSLAYIDIDNFKFVNDTRGHSVGDQLLIEVAKSLKESLRATDTVARLGGDEFACLLPETGQEEAKAAFGKASELLEQRMKNSNWSVTFSVGLVTFEMMPDDIKEAVKIADELMYSVKNLNKNNVSYKIWHGKV